MIGAAWLLLFSPGARGETKSAGDIASIPPEVKIRMEAHPNAATVGDPVRLDLDITTPPGYQAEVPKPSAQVGDFSIAGFSSGPAVNQAQAGTLAHHRTQITAAIYKTGKFTFPPLPIKLKTAEGKEIIAASPSVEIEIRSVLTAKDPGLKDLKKQAEIPEPVRWLLWAGLIVLGCLLCAVAWFLWRRRHRNPVPLTPAQTQDLLDTAEADLRKLLSRGPPDRGMEKQFYIALSEIVKRILEAGYEIHSAEQTTSEIMNSLRDKSILNSESRDQIQSLLVRCDVVKFAKYVPAKTEHDAGSQEALGILAEAKKAVGSRQSAVGSKTAD
jgi:hypothetical protein